MAWKKKEKELTPREAIALAKENLTKYWHNSPPMIMGVKKDQTASAHPLDPEFPKKIWLILFIDPSELESEYAIKYCAELYFRYSPFQIHFMAVISRPYSFYEDPEVIMDIFIKQKRISTPLVLDSDSSLAASFGVEKFPSIVFYSKGEVIWSQSGLDQLNDLETVIQKLVRKEDPGLPLRPSYVPDETASQSVLTLDFGKGRNCKFELNVDQPENVEKEKETVFAYGKWKQDAESITTSDREARLQFSVETSRFCVVAKKSHKENESSRILIEVNDDPVFEKFAGKDLKIDGAIGTYLEVKLGKLYVALENLPQKSNQVTFKFPTADRFPVSLFGVRFNS